MDALEKDNSELKRKNQELNKKFKKCLTEIEGQCKNN